MHIPRCRILLFSLVLLTLLFISAMRFPAELSPRMPRGKFLSASAPRWRSNRTRLTQRGYGAAAVEALARRRKKGKGFYDLPDTPLRYGNLPAMAMKATYRHEYHRDLRAAVAAGMRILDENRYMELSLSENKKMGFLRDWEMTDRPIRRILIVTTWRSGSTFLGEFLNHIPGTFYSYEPLLERTLRNDSTSLPSPAELVSGVLNCNLSHHEFDDHFGWVLKHNRRYFDMCSALQLRHGAPGSLCNSVKILERACRRFPVQLAKTVRFRLDQLEKVFEHIPDLRVIALFRDPRAIIVSRSKQPWCLKKRCSNVRQVCQDYTADLEEAIRVKNERPDRTFILRYEDLCLDPKGYMEKLMSFLSLPATETMEYYLNAHTSYKGKKAKQSDNIYHQTYRDSRNQVFLWRQEYSAWNITSQVQAEGCGPAMDRMGYVKVEEEALNNYDVSLIKTASEVGGDPKKVPWN